LYNSAKQQLSVNHDAAGNVLNDGMNQYLYDGEGRICAVASSPMPSMMIMTGYIYDADGTRVAKGSISAWSCDPAVNGFQTTSDYVLGLGGEQVAEMGVGGATDGTTTSGLAWQHTNVWAGGKLLGTYDNDGLHFYFNDPLGTRRAQTDYEGVVEQTCQSLPFGDGETCQPTPTEHLFTAKERDQESGNDYFGARYFGSNMGRFLSPDSVGGSPDDPQSWNLYGYVLNNPLKNTDPDGHDVQICDNNGHCSTPISNDAYKAAQQASNQGGLSAPTLYQVGNSKDANGNFTAVAITNSSGQQVGTATYVPDEHPGTDPYVGNNMAGLQTIGATNKVVTYAVVGTGAVYGGFVAAAAAPAAAAAVGRWGLQRLAIGASSPALLNLINRLYQVQDEIEGGTAGAVRNEVMTGEYINGGHSIKAAEMITALQNLIKSGQLSGSDQTIAGHIISDLKNSLGR
jgi:RHS repeat-associated protein